MAHELFSNIEQFTKQVREEREERENSKVLPLAQARKAAESLESAMEASKTKVIRGKYVSRESLGDMENVRTVVDDFKTAIKSLGDPPESEPVENAQETETEIKNGGVKPLQAEPAEGSQEGRQPQRTETKGLEEKMLTNNNLEPKKNIGADQSLQFPLEYSDDLQSQPSRYELLSNIDMYTIASQTQDFIGGLLGGYTGLVCSAFS